MKGSFCRHLVHWHFYLISVSFLMMFKKGNTTEKQQSDKMAGDLSNFAMKVLCRNQGCLEYHRLKLTVWEKFNVEDQQLFETLTDSSRFVRIQGREKKILGCNLSPDSIIVAKTPVRLCKSYPACEKCDDLHLCRYFALSNCRYGSKCKKSHNIHSDHNGAVLRDNFLQDLDEAELFQLLLQNDSYLLPKVCPHYNKGSGPHGSCIFKERCTSLHVCQHYLQGACKFGDNCKRSHKLDIDLDNSPLGDTLSAKNTCSLPVIYKNKFRIDSCAETTEGKQQDFMQPQNSVSEVDANEICLFFIRKHCSFEDKCVRVHYHLPYKWKILDSDGTTWKYLPNMEEIEKAYCDPENSTSLGSPAVNFLTMTCGPAEVRRLSTASSVTKPPHVILTTEWVWYWKNEFGKWIEYGCPEDEQSESSSVTSSVLEKVYLADNESDVPFITGGQQYILSFKDMYQQDRKNTAKREVRRRPRFVSAQDVERKIKSVSLMTPGSADVSIPSHWVQVPLLDFTHKLVHQSKSGEEYRQIETLFRRSMATSTIHKIQRIQNLYLWNVFQWQKDQMMKRNGGKTVNECFLFHGTEKSLIKAICEQNFDRGISGAHNAYGIGNYFSRDASYFHNNSKPTTGSRIMFVARVLVGDFSQGNSNYLHPPLKEGNSVFYDSCVDSTSNPSVFVIFEKHQIYPEYLIEYS
ncbi:protein mono-ADP-ribosyltransferase PARP12-like isoform X2 [Lepisosteus oculatus]|uniref:protein mono-ADP-ribosyltransferase PARP12-like isoform X2 n=1 Tax=Lepisosteus oculatus TaxID=7918 RepID=UPI003721B30A